jgi:hypothetical protein
VLSVGVWITCWIRLTSTEDVGSCDSQGRIIFGRQGNSEDEIEVFDDFILILVSSVHATPQKKKNIPSTSQAAPNVSCSVAIPPIRESTSMPWQGRHAV